MNIVETVDVLKQLSSLVGEQIKKSEKELELSMALEKDSSNPDILGEMEKIIKEKNELNQQIKELEKKLMG